MLSAATGQKLSPTDSAGQEENRRKTGNFTLLVSTGHEASAPRWPTGATAAVSLASAPRRRMAVDAGRARHAEDCGPGDPSGRPFHRPSAGSFRGARTAPHDRMARAGRPRTAKPPV